MSARRQQSRVMSAKVMIRAAGSSAYLSNAGAACPPDIHKRRRVAIDMVRCPYYHCCEAAFPYAGNIATAHTLLSGCPIVSIERDIEPLPLPHTLLWRSDNRIEVHAAFSRVQDHGRELASSVSVLWFVFLGPYSHCAHDTTGRRRHPPNAIGR